MISFSQGPNDLQYMESSMELNDPPHQDLRRRLSNPDLNDLRATAASMDLSDLPHRDLRRRLSNPGLIDLRATAASMDLSDPPHRDLRRGSSKHSKRVVHHPSNRAGLTKSSLP
ncbi:unnamed protein product [Tilletia laevis]|uniref:Uncharacterized protein n=3 Tax=Tilletia TaxID=13289 RepID=A0A8X7SVP6_9BASI|nr:hypothetical protein CF335_g4153 [Tilletia laevis]KAE8245941.1 hypothetical protein A4X06_0g5311 [Tilletia controversa]KAE8259103.1 hypothetical protein A4X03_0g4190 [Tilletia caries]CAD6947427.1 unnamed protein product [Tilletia laevis]CAD6973052.1 unnamed protein product [Tilletia controversa]